MNRDRFRRRQLGIGRVGGAGLLLLLAAALPACRSSAVETPAPIAAVPAAAGGDRDRAVQAYATFCAVCHGADRLGGSGPALLPENLGRLSAEAAAAVIRDGRAATQMPAYGEQLDEATLAALVGLIYEPLPELPVWGEAEIARTHQRLATPAPAPVPPVADPLNMFVVVETGDHHVTLLDGDHFEPVTRFATRINLHGGPKFSPDGRFVYFASRDGWIAKYDLHALEWIAEIRAGINTRNAAISHDGRYVLVGNYLPHSLVLLDARDLSLVQVIPALGPDGRSSRVSAVYQAAPRGAFVAALKDVPALLELPVPVPEAGESGHRMYGYGPFSEERLRATRLVQIRRLALETVLDDFFFDPEYTHLLGADRDGSKARVIHLDSGRQVAAIELRGMPHLGSGISWERDGRRVMATPNLRSGMVSVIEMGSWQIVGEIETAGPGFFLRSHEDSAWAWVDVFFGPNRDVMHVVDKQSFEIVASLRPEPGRTAAHVEFDRSGRHALVSIWEDDGALLVYDAQTLEIVRRLPMRKPSGKYNVYNKITLSEGTSH